MTTTKKDEMLSIAEACVAIAKKKGAKDAAARAYRMRDVSMDWRDGKVEKISDATTRGVGMQFYVDGRFSTASTSDLRPEALDTFIADAVALSKNLAEDPFRLLPDPELYKGQASIDLKIEDPKYATVTADARRKLVKEMEAAARGVEGADAILSVTTSWSDSLNESFFVTSNGFSGQQRNTSFFISASVSVKDKDGRRPEDYSYAGSRIYAELPAAGLIGRDAASRAISRLGSKKGESAQLPMVLDNRAAGRMVSFFGQALSGGALQQKRSFLEGKLGQQVASEIVTIIDDPLIPKGFGSRLFDIEGIAAKPRPIIEAGVLKNFYIDTYYGRKLKMAPTSGSTSNHSWKLGAKSQKELLNDIKDGIFVTSFLGGNSNSLTGDFSVGVQGFLIRDGKLAEAIGEMNISGNHLELWKKVTAVGNDPYPYSTLRTPSLVFDAISFAGV